MIPTWPAAKAGEAMQALPETDRQLTIATRSEDDFLRVSITDNGHGISTENLARLFNPFFTTKSEGMGLGLSISRQIVEALHGQISAENVRGSDGKVLGARFIVRLPKAIAPS